MGAIAPPHRYSQTFEKLKQWQYKYFYDDSVETLKFKKDVKISVTSPSNLILFINTRKRIIPYIENNKF